MGQAWNPELIGGRQGGIGQEPGSVDDLIRSLMPGLLVRASRLVHSREEARDIVQESLLIAFTKLEQLRDPESFPAWLKSIVDSQCHRHLRKRGREVPLTVIERIEPLATHLPDPASEYERARFREAVDSALSGLPMQLGEVSRLYYQSGYSLAEIADRLEIKPGTVRKRLHTAQPLLAEALSGRSGETTLRVGYLPISDHLLGMVAHSLGQGRHSTIHMQRFLSWNVLSEALVRGRIDAAFIMAPLAMQLCNSGTSLKYVLDGHHDGSALAASTKKLKGKLVGVPGRYSTHRVLLGTLAREYPQLLDDISTADTNPSYAIRSLRRQIIDAFFCAEPWSTKCMREGEADVILRSKDVMPGHPCCVVAVREDFSLEHPDHVAGYARSLLKARDRLKSDPGYCARVQEEYTGIQSELAEYILTSKVVTFDDLRPDMGRMADFMELALASGVLSTPCDLESFVCKDFF